jgi:hypothetical protein
VDRWRFRRLIVCRSSLRDAGTAYFQVCPRQKPAESGPKKMLDRTGERRDFLAGAPHSKVRRLPARERSRPHLFTCSLCQLSRTHRKPLGAVLSLCIVAVSKSYAAGLEMGRPGGALSQTGSEISVNEYLAGPVPDWVSRPEGSGASLKGVHERGAAGAGQSRPYEWAILRRVIDLIQRAPSWGHCWRRSNARCDRTRH